MGGHATQNIATIRLFEAIYVAIWYLGRTKSHRFIRASFFDPIKRVWAPLIQVCEIDGRSFGRYETIEYVLKTATLNS